MRPSRTMAGSLLLLSLLAAGVVHGQVPGGEADGGVPGGEVPCEAGGGATPAPETITGQDEGVHRRSRSLGPVSMEGELFAASEAIRTALECEQVECDCAEALANVDGAIIFRLDASDSCAEVSCRCVEGGPAGVALPPGVLDDVPLLPAPTPELGRERYEPGPVLGFPLQRGRVGLQLEMGWPFVDVRFAYGINDAVQIGAGYRGLYTESFGGYGLLKVRLYANPLRRAALSLVVLGGYSRVSGSGEDHDRITSHVGGDSGFGEVSLAASVGRGRHWFIFHVGARLGWVDSRAECDDEWGCSFQIFDDGEAGMLVTAFVEIGYAVRVGRVATFFATTGVDAKTNSDSIPGMPRARLGVAFDFDPGRSRGRR